MHWAGSWRWARECVFRFYILQTSSPQFLRSIEASEPYARHRHKRTSLGRWHISLWADTLTLESIEVRHGVSKTSYDIWCIINISYVIFGFCILRFQVWVLKNPHLFNKWSKLFRDVKFWNGQTQNSVETVFLSERANTQLFRTSKIFEIGALFVKLEGFLYWSQVLETFHAYLKHTYANLTSIQKSF